MSKSRRAPAKEHVSIPMDKADIARIDALTDCFSAPWRKGTRSDVVRALLTQELERAEQGELLYIIELRIPKEGGST
jgi:hypothetical protein